MRLLSHRGSRTGSTLVESLVAIALLAFAVAFVSTAFSSYVDMKRESVRVTEASRLASQLLEVLRSTPLDYIVPDPAALPLSNLTLAQSSIEQTEDLRTKENIYSRLAEYDLDASITVELFQGRSIPGDGRPQTVRLCVIVADQKLFNSDHSLKEPKINDIAVFMGTLMTRGSINP
ncbi:type II secretion system protein [bacterium]|nr:type II secretion system protein [bacterium]